MSRLVFRLSLLLAFLTLALSATDSAAASVPDGFNDTEEVPEEDW